MEGGGRGIDDEWREEEREERVASQSGGQLL